MALLGRSDARLALAHPDLQRLFREVAKAWDVLILETLRSPARQRELYAAKKSKTLDSKHLAHPSDGLSWAVDAAPDPVDWRDTERFYFFGGYVEGVADRLGIKIRWGGDWDSDTQVSDQQFNDLVHFERIE